MTNEEKYKWWAIALLAVGGVALLIRTQGNPLSQIINSMNTNPKLPRGYRNNNPLNIRFSIWNAWNGKILPNTDGSFEQFSDMAYGYRAALKLIRKYIKQGHNTVAKIINRWAPESDGNYTQAYIDHVCEFANLNRDMVINPDDRDTITAMVRAMSIIENGTKDKDGNNLQSEYNLPNMETINQGWDLL